MHEGERNERTGERSELHGPTASLSQYLAPVRNQSRVVILVTVVVVALGVTVALAGPRSYTATTSVVVQPVSANPSEAIEATERIADMATEARIAASQAVAVATSDGFRELAVEIEPDAVADRITITNRPEDSRVLDIAYRASDPSVARVGSELAAAAYLEYRSALNTATLEASRTAVDERIAELQDRLVDVDERIDETAIGSPARLAVEVEQTSIQGELAAQQRALAGLSTLAVDTATVIDEARQPSTADGLGAAQIIAGALAGGLVLGVIAAWIIDAIGLPAAGGRAAPSTTPRPAAPTTTPEANGAEPSQTPKGRFRRRRRKAEQEPDDVDDPFDDTDDRDPLELLKALDVIEADPSIAFKASKEKKERAKAEAAAAEAGDAPDEEQKSFAELYPVEYFDADGDAGSLIDKLEARSDDDDHEIGQVRTDEELLSSVDRLLRSPTGRLPDPVEPAPPAGPAADDRAEADPTAAESTLAEPTIDAGEQLAWHDQLPDHGIDESAMAVEEPALGTRTADIPLGDADETAPTVADDVSPDAGGDASWASDPAAPLDATFDDIGLGDDSTTGAMAGLGGGVGEVPPLDDLSEFPPPTDLPIDVSFEEHAFDGPVSGDETPDPTNHAGDGGLDDDGFRDAGITSGDPSDLDPGPPSWDEPFIGPVTWDELSARPGADATPARPGPGDDAELTSIDPRVDDRIAAPPAAEPGDLAPPPAELRATDDLGRLLDQLARIGGDGPVTLLSVSDRDPTAGLTTGFEVADELRATGSRVLLIDTRLEEPVLDALFDGEPRCGLAQVMAGDEVLDQAIRTLEGLDGLSLLPVGAVGPDTAELLTGPALPRLLSQAQLDFGSIVIIGESLAGPEVDPTTTRARTRALAEAADGLIVGTTDPIGSGPDEEVVEALDELPAPTLQLLAAHLPVAETTTEPASV